MKKNIVFFNHGGLGDIHVSRSFISDIINKYQQKCSYCSNHKNNILKDIDIEMNNMLPFFTREIKIEALYGTYYVNTWYGHGTHTTLHTLYNNFKRLYDMLKIQQQDILSYIPKIDYIKFDISKINDFVEYNKKCILICNNECKSGQSTNFDMNPLIESISSLYKEYTIIVTNSEFGNIYNYNVVYFDDILHKTDTLNEISYLSTKCDVIIGRNSGPHTFCYVKENIDRKCCFVSIVNNNWPYHDFGLTKLNISSTFSRVDSNDNIIYNVINNVERFYNE